MKKNISINLFGTLYNIDDDAYELLEGYLANMKSYFSKREGGEEITDDIEHRIAELFWEAKENGTQCIDIEQVKSIIEKIGNPEQMDADNTQSSSNAEDTQGNVHSAYTEQNTNGRKNIFSREGLKEWMSKRKFFRDNKDKLLGGVLSGMSHYFGNGDSLVWRLAFVLLFICFGSSSLHFLGIHSLSLSTFLIIAYFIAWLIAPEAKSVEDRLWMRGAAVTPDSIKDEVLREQNGGDGNATQQNTGGRGCLSTMVSLFVYFAKFILLLVLLGLFASVVAMGIAFVSLLFGGSLGLGGLLTAIPGEALEFAYQSKWLFTALLVCGIIITSLPIYGAIRLIRPSSKSLSTITTIVLIIIWCIAFFLLIPIFVGLTAIGEKIGDDRRAHIHTDSDVIQTYQVDNFHGIRLDGVGNVEFTQDSTVMVKAEGVTKLVDATTVQVEDGILVINTPTTNIRNSEGNRLNFYISAPLITDLVNEGMGSFKIEDGLTQVEPFTVKNEGVGAIAFSNLTCGNLTLSNNGVGAMKFFNTKCANLSVRSDGVGATRLEVEADTISVIGEGVGAIEIKGTAKYLKKVKDHMIGKVITKELEITD